METDILWGVGVPLGCAAFAGVGTYLVVRRDFTLKVTCWATAGCAVLIGLFSLFVLYLSVLAFLGAMTVYLVLRRLVPRAVQTLAVTSAVLLGGLGVAVLIMSLALDSM